MSGYAAILVSSYGEVTTPRFGDRAAPGDPDELLRAIRHLLESPEPAGAALPSARTLVGWTDASALPRFRAVNAKATSLMRSQFRAPTAIVCGPLLITGGTPTHPTPFPRERASRLAATLFGPGPARAGAGAARPPHRPATPH